jgi:hypothetical protein
MVTQVIAQAGPALEIARNGFKGNGTAPEEPPTATP